MTTGSQNSLTQDAFLGGLVMLWQPRKGYRAGVDPVLLAASVAAQPGQSVLDLGCGVGAAALCLGARVPGLTLHGVERDADTAQLATRNGLDVTCCDLVALPADLRARQFDHVLANPPYYNRGTSRPSGHAGREAAHGEDTPLAKWIKVAAKRLKPKGSLHVIHRAERLPALLAALPDDMGTVAVLPICGRPGRVAERVILRARKGGRGEFVLHPQLVMHSGGQHVADAVKDYTAQVRGILRDGDALDF